MANSKTPAKTDDGLLSGYAIVKHSPQALAELVTDVLAGSQLGYNDIPTVGMPAGGSQFWDVPTIGGDSEPVKTLSGVVIFRHMRRAYWTNPEPQEGAQPDCFSPDGEVGFGQPGGDCTECPLAQFGSGRNNAQACTQRHPVYLVLPNTILPLRVNVGPTSIAVVRSFAIGLLNQAQLPLHAVLTELSLTKATNQGGQDYSKLVMKMTGQLSESELEAVTAYRDNFIPQIETMLRQQRSAGRAQQTADSSDEGDDEQLEEV